MPTKKRGEPKAFSGGGDPESSWRADLCFPLVAIYCLPIAIGHVMTRLGLGICGGENPNELSSAMNAVITVLLIYMILYFTVYVIVDPVCFQGDTIKTGLCDDPADVTLVALLEFATISLWIFFFFLIVVTRSYIRKKDNIPNQYCLKECPGGCEDCMMGCCWSLTVIQMHRHIDDHRYCREIQHGGIDAAVV